MADNMNRSPSHPAFDLQTAIQQARVIYQAENFNWTSAVTAMSHWGYKSKSSSGLRSLAALLQYGLLEEGGKGANRRIRISELAKSILLDEREDSRERRAAIRKAALSPKIHAFLWNEWGPRLPSDKEMSFQLVRRYNFNPKSVPRFIKGLKATIDLAKLAQSGIVSEDENGEPDGGRGASDERHSFDGQGVKMPSIGRKDARPWDLVIPLISGGQAVLRTPIPLTEDDYDLLTATLDTMLKSMKRAITRPDRAEQE